MSKYYTPIIEEFHIGFEFEQVREPWDINDKSTRKWQKVTYSGNINSISNFGLFVDEIRVKTLDKEDIESLGFRESKEEDKQWTWGSEYEKDICDDTIFTLLYNTQANLWRLAITSRYDWEGHNELWFTIKNKNELIKLLKQLNIDG